MIVKSKVLHSGIDGLGLNLCELFLLILNKSSLTMFILDSGQIFGVGFNNIVLNKGEGLAIRKISNLVLILLRDNCHNGCSTGTTPL